MLLFYGNFMPELSIIMPCLNEAETLKCCIKKAQLGIARNNISAEIIIADNGSTDNSEEIAITCGARVINVPLKGYGAALAGGIAAASGKYIVIGDADCSYDFSNIAPFITKLRQGFDLVMGCRLPTGGGSIMPGAMPLKHRLLGNPLLSFMGRLFFQSSITDFHCGLRGFTKEAVEKMDLHTTGMEFASEMVIKATLLKMKIAEIPITLYPDGRDRSPHLRSWRDGWRHLRFMLMYSPKWLFLWPGIILCMTGGYFFARLWHHPILLFGNNIFLGTNTYLISAMNILIGFQLIAFYFFTKVFAIMAGFLPGEIFLYRLFRFVKLETGILTGLLVVSIGLFFLLSALWEWHQYSYGNLPPTINRERIIPAVTFILLGVQIIFSSFFLSILGLKHK